MPSNTVTNGFASESNVDYEAMIQTFQRLSKDKEYEYIELYIGMCLKNPFAFVTLDQHVQIFNKLGIPVIKTEADTDRQVEDSLVDVNGSVVGFLNSDVQRTTDLQLFTSTHNNVMNSDVKKTTEPAKCRREDNSTSAVSGSEDASLCSGEQKTKKFKSEVPDIEQPTTIKRKPPFQA